MIDGTPAPGDGARSRDDVLELLSSRTRRAVLVTLRADHPRSLGDLADEVLADDRVPVDSRERLCSRLHHVHLPQLESVGVVRYDPTANTVHYRGHERVEACLSRLRDGDGD